MSFLTPVEGTPGWFDDPTTPGVTRYWDGQRWTERSFGEPLPPPGPAGTGPGGPSGPRAGAPTFVPSTERGPRPGAPTDSGAIWALVLAIIGCFSGIPAIVVGGKARRRIRYSGGRLAGDGIALAAQIIGWTWLVLTVASMIIVIALGATAEPSPTLTPVTTVPN